MHSISKIAITAALCALTLTACNDDKKTTNDTITQQGLSECFAVVTDKTGAEATRVIYPVNITYLLNWTTAKCDATITGLTLGGQNLPSINLTGMKWNLSEDGWGETEADRPNQNTGAIANAPVVTDFELEWLFRLDLANATETYDPVCSFEFDLDSRYHYVGSRQPSYMGGNTTVTCPSLPAFSYEDAIYSIKLDFTSMKADLTINGAKFNQMMPSLNMDFKNIPFTFGHEQGSFKLTCGELVPEMNGRPMPGFPITNFEAIVFPGHDTELQFDCTPETMPMTFHVKAEVDGADYNAAL